MKVRTLHYAGFLVAWASSPCWLLRTGETFDIKSSLQQRAPNTGGMPVPRGRRRGFTLVEVLAATLLIAIVLPSIMQGVSVATRAATTSRYRNEATTLAQQELSTLIATGQWQGGTLSGDFGPDWPRYHWQATVGAWAADTTGAGMQQLDVQVTWVDRNNQDSITLSTIIYPSTQQQSQTSTTATQ